MGQWNALVTGDGSAEIDTGTSQFVYGWEVYSLTFTSPRVREISDQEPLQYQYAGSIGLASLSGATLQVKFFTQVRFAAEFHEVHPGTPFVDYVFWKLPPGIEIGLQVYW